jgi:hypothetical protein
VVSLVAELRGHERQTAEELGQRKTRVEEHKPLDASPAAIKPAARHGGESYELAIERYLIKRDEWLQQRCAEAPGPGAPRLADVVAALNQRIGMLGEVAALAP